MEREIIKAESMYDYFKEETALLTMENNQLKDKERTQRLSIEMAKDKILHSNIPIREGANIIAILNYPEDDTCSNDSVFFDKKYTNQELKRVLEMI